MTTSKRFERITNALSSRYKFTGQVLKGGQGTVLVYFDESLERKVAVKVLHDVSDGEALRREVSARAHIQSKHVAEIYDCIFDSDGSLLALILEFISGLSLEELDLSALDERKKLELLYQLACGLTDLHASKVIHRDIKPDNIKIDAGGVVKIFDLGISNLDAASAVTNKALGTRGFRAPELYSPPPIPVSTAADIYAFGVIAWRILSGHIPGVLLELPPQGSAPVPSLAPHLSDVECVRLLDTSLSITPGNRPTAQEIRDELHRLLIFGLHRAVLSGLKRGTHVIQTIGVPTKFSRQSDGIAIKYDGNNFVVTLVDGEIRVNNLLPTVGDMLPDSCIIAFGAPEAGAGRRFVPFNVSKPEIVV